MVLTSEGFDVGKKSYYDVQDVYVLALCLDD